MYHQPIVQAQVADDPQWYAVRVMPQREYEVFQHEP